MSRTLPRIPAIEVLTLARIDGVPESHPEHLSFEPFPVHGFAIRHPDGVIVVDTGIGFDNVFINDLYPHHSVGLIAELHRCDIDERDVQLIVNSHLHFDHCGQNSALCCKFAVQQSELEAASAPYYTVPEWAAIDSERVMSVRGDVEIAPGCMLLHTPGHTPGHQAVVLRSADETVIIAAQCVFRAGAWSGPIEAANLHAPEMATDATQSLRRLRALRPSHVYLSHDASPAHE